MGNLTTFYRFSVPELDARNADGTPCYALLVRYLIEHGYRSDFLDVAPDVHARALGELDSIDYFFHGLDALARSSDRIDTLAFLLCTPSRADAVAHFARLPPAGVAFWRIGAVVLCREEFLALRAVLQRRPGVLEDELEYVLNDLPPEADEIDVWLTQGDGGEADSEATWDLDRFPEERGNPPPAEPLGSGCYLQLGLLLLGGLFALPILWIILATTWHFLSELSR
jgi:hypothetical protein